MDMNTEKELIEEYNIKLGKKKSDIISYDLINFTSFIINKVRQEALAEKGLIRIEDVEKIIDELSKKKIKSTKEWEKINCENISLLEEIENYNKQIKQQLKNLGEKWKP